MPQTLLDRLAGRFPAASRQTLKRMVLGGRVRINSRPAKKLSQPVAEGDVVQVLDRAETRAARRPPSARAARHGLSIVFEDADLLVADKPAGLLTSTSPGERRPTLLAAVTNYLAETDSRARVGLIHRLDRHASGLLVFSKNDAAYRSLKAQFFHHQVERVYAAVVAGLPARPAGLIESRLIERADGTIRSTPEHAAGQKAVTGYEVLRTDKPRRLALLRVTLHTGRKHQIRAHLSEHGMPILGDPLYRPPRNETDQGRVGKKPADGAPPPGRLMLAAVRLAVAHPADGRRLTFEVPPPPQFTSLWPDAGAALARPNAAGS